MGNRQGLELWPRYYKDTNSNIIQISNDIANTNKNLANLLVNHYSKMIKLDFQAGDKNLNKTVRSILLKSRTYKIIDNFSRAIDKTELNAAIHQIHDGKTPGNDLVFGEMVKSFGETAKDYFLDIINTSWSKGKLPKVWKTSIIAPILKPGKSAEE